MFALMGFVGSCVVMVLVGVIVFSLLDDYDIPESVKGMIVAMISFTIGYTVVYRQITKEISAHENYRKHLEKLKQNINYEFSCVNISNFIGWNFYL